MSPFERELEILRPIVLDVGRYVCRLQKTAMVSEKAGGEPVTEADREANRRLVAAIHEHFPNDYILAEESFIDDQSWTKAERSWLIDPIDGTREYIEGRDDFSIMVGLAIEGCAAFGIVYQASLDHLFWGGPACGSFLETKDGRRQLKVEPPIELSEMTGAISRSHVPPNLKRCLELLGIKKSLGRGSVGVKVALVSSGEADLYIHLSKGTKAWDLCAPDAILSGAGGMFTDCFGSPFDYRAPNIENCQGIIASRCHHQQIVERLEPVSQTFRH